MKQPAAPQSEDCLIGSILKRADVLYPVQIELQPEDFFQDGARAIYRELCDLAPTLKSDEIDTSLLADRLLAKGRFVNAQDDLRSYLIRCRQDAKIANLDNYIAEVKDKAILRAIIATMGEYRDRAMATPSPRASELSSEAEARLSDIFHRDVRRSYVRVGDLAAEVAEQMISGVGGATGIPTGFAALDRITGGGLQRKEYSLIAARPGMGKTAIALNIAQAAADGGAKIAIFSLEMTAQALVTRAICSRAGVRSRRSDPTPYSEDETARVRDAAIQYYEQPYYIFDEPVSAITMRATAMRIAREAKGLDLIIVDYLQIVASDTQKRNDNREQEVARISKAMKQLAKDLNVAVLVLAQLSRKCEQRTPARPVLSDLRESGQIEQDVDLGMLLYRGKFYDTKAGDAAELIVAKQRDGATGIVNLTYSESCVNFQSA